MRSVCSSAGSFTSSGGSLLRPNRLLVRLLSEVPNDATALARLFSTRGAYESNLRSVFERRIAQLEGLDATLRRYLLHGVEDLPKYSRVCFSRMFEALWIGSSN